MKRMLNRIGIIGAMENEVASIIEASSVIEVKEIASMKFTLASLYGHEAVIVQSGMGKVNAGICAQTLINVFQCTSLINSGVAGSLDNRMGIGDFVISLDASQHDFDVSPIGFKKGEIPYTGLYAFKADERLVKQAEIAVKEVAPSSKVYLGRVCSGDQFIIHHSDKQRIVDEFGGLCCEMEGAAIAHVCHLNAVPFVIIRCISDKPDGSAIMDFEEFSAKAAIQCASVVKKMIAAL